MPAIEEIIGGTSYTRYLFLLRFHQQAIEILHFKPVILKSWRNLKFVGSPGLSRFKLGLGQKRWIFALHSHEREWFYEKVKKETGQYHHF